MNRGLRSELSALSQRGGRVLAFGDSIELGALCDSIEARGIDVCRREQLRGSDGEVAAQSWLAWLIDLGTQGVAIQLSGLLSQGCPPKTLLIALGRARPGTVELDLAGAMRFARPLDVPAIVHALLVALRRPSEPPPKPGLPTAMMSVSPPGPDGSGPQAEQSEVSPELAALLREAERRVEDSSSGEIVGLRSTGSVGAGRELAIPVELGLDVWQALEEPLDEEEEFEQRDRHWRASAPGLEESLPGLSLPPVYREEALLHSSLPVPSPPAGGLPMDSAGPVPNESPDNRPTSASLSGRPVWGGPAPLAGEASELAPRDLHSTLPPAEDEVALRSGLPLPAPQAKAAVPLPELDLPDVLIQGAAAGVLAQSIAQRASGCLVFEVEQGLRHVVMREGDPIVAISAVHGESLVAFLALRGHLSPEVAGPLEHQAPTAGRRAGAALIAHGHLRQGDLWEVLKSHAIWVLGRVLAIDRGTVRIEPTSQRLADEPEVFRGLTGAALFVEVAQRTVEPTQAAAQLQRQGSYVTQGPHHSLLAECGLRADETALFQERVEPKLARILDAGSPERACVLWALERLGVVRVRPAEGSEASERHSGNALLHSADADAWRSQVRARRRLVDEGDYFTLLGVSRSASGYAVRAAYLELRRQFDPGRAPLLDAAMEGDLALIAEVLEEAYEILRDAGRRERYRQAIETRPS